MDPMPKCPKCPKNGGVHSRVTFCESRAGSSNTVKIQTSICRLLLDWRAIVGFQTRLMLKFPAIFVAGAQPAGDAGSGSQPQPTVTPGDIQKRPQV